MAFLHADSFDFYTVQSGSAGAEAEVINYGNWTGGSLNSSAESIGTNTRFGYGKSLRIGNAGANVYKTLASNTSNTVFVAVAIYADYALSGTSQTGYIQFLQGGTTAQVTIVFISDGSIKVYRGGTGGTLLATYTGAFSGQTWAHFQFKVIIDPTVGEIHVRKNGNTVDDFSTTGLNTRSTANAYADGVKLGQVAGSGTLSCMYDDFMFYDNSGTQAPNDWVGEIRAYTASPNGAGAASNLSGYAAPSGFNSTSTTANITANHVRYGSFTATYSGTVSKLTVPFNAAMTGNAKCGIYSDSGGSPSALLGTSAQVTNPVLGNNDFTFSSPPTVVAGTTYWYALITDTTAPVYATGSTGKDQAQTYGSGLPNPAASLSSGAAFYATVSWSVSGWGATAQTSPDGDMSYAYGATVTDDLYTQSGLSVTPTTILAVVQRAVVRKTDTTARSAQTEMKSGATTVQGSSTVLGTGYQGLITTYTQDPNTSAAWTVSAVNSVQIGVKISA